MRSLMMFVMLLAAAPAPAPTAAPSDAPHATPLTEIGRTRSAPICTAIVVHANGAITTTLDNDRTLAIITHNLKATNFDGLNSLQRRNAIEELLKTASTIRQNGKVADGEIKQLRAYADAATDPERKAELKTFTDALGGALFRQSKEANEVVSALTILQSRGEAQEARGIMAANNQLPENVVPSSTTTTTQVLPDAPDSTNAFMRELADGLIDRAPGIAGDEGIAADHSIAATSGC
jgi:hypothetical protein